MVEILIPIAIWAYIMLGGFIGFRLDKETGFKMPASASVLHVVFWPIALIVRLLCGPPLLAQEYHQLNLKRRGK